LPDLFLSASLPEAPLEIPLERPKRKAAAARASQMAWRVRDLFMGRIQDGLSCACVDNGGNPQRIDKLRLLRRDS
jgi:hypothetical protein